MSDVKLSNLPDDVLDRLRPNDKLIYLVLATEGELTNKQISKIIRCKTESVKRMTARMREEGVIDSRQSLTNGAMKIHCVNRPEIIRGIRADD